MFKFNSLRRRVSFHNSQGLRNVRIERQNTPDLYVWGFFLSTFMCVFMFRMLWDAAQRHWDEVVYILPAIAP